MVPHFDSHYSAAVMMGYCDDSYKTFYGRSSVFLSSGPRLLVFEVQSEVSA